jgi:anti-sigma-K factor RskA
MTTPHEGFDEALAAFAVDALDDSERASFDVHLSWCTQCQADLAELRRVAAGLGLSVEPVAPPEALKAKVMARAAAQPQRRAVGPGPAAGPVSARRGLAMRQQRLAVIAGIALLVATGIYAISLRLQVDDLRRTVILETSAAATARDQVAALRRDIARMATENAVLTAPDVIRVELSGRDFAATATGRAFWSSSQGLLFAAQHLPGLDPSRIYQLWVIPPGAPPVSAGVLTITPEGMVTHVVTLPSGLPASVSVAVSVEPSGGSPQPTGRIVLASF